MGNPHDYKGREMYAGKDMRYKMEYDNSMMIHEDRSKIANLPQEHFITAYPMSPAYNYSYVSDTIVGIDHQQDEDSRKGKKETYPEKY